MARESSGIVIAAPESKAGGIKGLPRKRNANLRISPELHERLAIEAQAQGKSINTLAQEALQERVAF